jgi:hypothetical protein
MLKERIQNYEQQKSPAGFPEGLIKFLSEKITPSALRMTTHTHYADTIWGNIVYYFFHSFMIL